MYYGHPFQKCMCTSDCVIVYIECMHITIPISNYVSVQETITKLAIYLSVLWSIITCNQCLMRLQNGIIFPITPLKNACADDFKLKNGIQRQTCMKIKRNYI